MGPYSVFTAATILATVAVTCNTVLVAQTSKEWSQCSGGEGPIVDVIISGCSAVIHGGHDSPKRLATAFNNRGVVYKFKGEYDRALDDYNRAILLNPSYANAYNNRGVIYRLKGDYDRASKITTKQFGWIAAFPPFFTIAPSLIPKSRTMIAPSRISRWYSDLTLKMRAHGPVGGADTA